MDFWRNSPRQDILALRTEENPHLGPKPVNTRSNARQCSEVKPAQLKDRIAIAAYSPSLPSSPGAAETKWGGGRVGVAGIKPRSLETPGFSLTTLPVGHCHMTTPHVPSVLVDLSRVVYLPPG
ncbi:hypothetical protein Hanom_Chr16g01443291 [Helianthus anomalus]